MRVLNILCNYAEKLWKTVEKQEYLFLLEVDVL